MHEEQESHKAPEAASGLNDGLGVRRSCNKCMVSKSVESFRLMRGYRLHMCLDCQRKERREKRNSPESKEKEREKQWRHDNIAKVRAMQKKDRAKRKNAMKEWRKNNQNKIRDSTRIWKDRNRNKIKDYNRARCKKGMLSLSRVYVASVLTQKTALKTEDIPEILIEVKRQHLQIMRLINEKR